MIKIIFITCGVCVASCSLYSMELAQKSRSGNKPLVQRFDTGNKPLVQPTCPGNKQLVQKTCPGNKYGWLYKLYGLNPRFSMLPERVKDKIRDEVLSSLVWYEDEVIEQNDINKISRLRSKLGQSCLVKPLRSGTIVSSGRGVGAERCRIMPSPNLTIEKVFCNNRFDKIGLLVKDTTKGSGQEQGVRWYIYKSYEHRTLDDLLLFLYPYRFASTKK